MNASLDKIIHKMQDDRLSEKQKITALSALHKLIKRNENKKDSVLYCTPFREIGEVSTMDSPMTLQTLIVVNFSPFALDEFPLIQTIEKRFGIKERIEIKKGDEYFLRIFSNSELEERLEIESSFIKLEDLSLQDACFLVIEKEPLLKKSKKIPTSKIHEKSKESSELVFMGRLLFSFWIVKQLLNKNAKAKIRCLSISDNRGMLSLSGTISGLFKTLVLENSNYAAKSIWVENVMDPSSYFGEKISAEICEMKPGLYDEVFLEKNLRQIKKFKEWKNSRNTIKSLQNIFQEESVILITGGLGSLGKIIATKLVENHQTKLILCGRSLKGELNLEQQAFLKKYADDTVYVQADVAKQNQVQSLLKKSKKYYGRIDGIIHSVGVIEDKWLLQKPLNSICKVIQSKILGAFYLDYYTRKEELKFFVNFSSIASCRGNIGQSDYASANAFLDHYTEARQLLSSKGERKGKSISINWPLWKDGGMRPSAIVIQQMDRHMGLTPLNTQEGIHSFQRILTAGEGQVVVTSGNHQKIKHRFFGFPKNSDDVIDIKQSNERKASFKSISIDELRQHLKSMMGQTLKLDLEEIHLEDNLSEYGFDSIFLTEFSNKIKNAYDFIQMDPSIFLEQTTLKGLSDFLYNKYSSSFTSHINKSLIETTIEKKTPLLEKELSTLDESLDAFIGNDEVESQKISPDESLHTIVGIEEEKSQKISSLDSEEIAIIGIGGKFPGSQNITDFWNHLVHDNSCITEVPKERWDWKNYYGTTDEENNETDCYHGSFIKGVGQFDPLHFNISPREAELMDPQHRLLLQATWETLENAGYSKNALKNKKTGVFIGIEKQDYLEVIRESGCSMDGYINTGNTHSMLANRISYFFDWKGPSLAIDTACSSSFSALNEAVKCIQNRETELALAGGVNVLLTPGIFIINRKMRMLTGEAHVKPFDKEASGHLYGEGLGLVFLKRLSSAIKDRDVIYGIIKGMSVRHGGKGLYLTAPNAESHKEVIEETLRQAKMQPDDIDYIEAQGTADPLTDTMELKVYHRLFSKVPEKQIKIGSIKGHIGHLGAASGVIALIKAILSLKNNQLVKVLNFTNLNWNQDNGSERFSCKVLDATIPWKPKSHNGKLIPRRIGIHNFGYGGVNGHMILEEYLAPKSLNLLPKEKEKIVLFSARTKKQLMLLAEQLLYYLETKKYKQYGFSAVHLQEIAYTLQVGREAMEKRVAFIVKDVPALIEILRKFTQGAENINGCYQGELKQGKELLSFFESDKDSRALIQKWIEKGRIYKLGELWVKGLSIDWELLYGNDKPHRISLPTYPFAKERYWVEGKKSEARSQESIGKDKLHPLVHENTSTLEEPCFSSTFTNEEFFLSDHGMKGRKALPGVAYLEMARAAVVEATSRTSGSIEEGQTNLARSGMAVTQLKKIVWASPIDVGKHPQEIHIGLFPEGNGQIQYEIYANIPNEEEDVDLAPEPLDPERVESPDPVDRIEGRRLSSRVCRGDRMVYSQGVATFTSFDKIPTLDLMALQSACNQIRFSSEQCYEAYKSIGIEYSPSHQGLEEVYVGSGQVLAKLSLPSCIADTQDQFVLHPSLMDSALQASIGLELTAERLKHHPSQISGFKSQVSPPHPFALESLEIFGRCPSNPWTLIRNCEGGKIGDRIRNSTWISAMRMETFVCGCKDFP